MSDVFDLIYKNTFFPAIFMPGTKISLDFTRFAPFLSLSCKLFSEILLVYYGRLVDKQSGLCVAECIGLKIHVSWIHRMTSNCHGTIVNHHHKQSDTIATPDDRT